MSSLLPPGSCLQFFIAHRVQQSHCSSIFHHRVLLTHALALSASQVVHKKKSQRIYTSMHSAGLELTKLTYTRLEDNLICHRGDRYKVCMDGGEQAGAKVQRGSDGPATRAQPCWPTHTADDVRRPPCDFVHRLMLKSTKGEDATT